MRVSNPWEPPSEREVVWRETRPPIVAGRPVPEEFRPLTEEQLSFVGDIARTPVFVSSETRARIMSWSGEYAALSREIDRRYATGRVAGVEELEARAAELEETIEEALQEIATGSSPAQTGAHAEELQVGLEESLARLYDDYMHPSAGDRFYASHFDPPGSTRETKLAEMVRSTAHDRIMLHGGEVALGFTPQAVTDEQAIAAARDAYERHMALRARYARRPKLGLSAEQLRRRLRPR